jgi:hypothetical protein
MKNQIAMDRMDAAMPTAFSMTGQSPAAYRGFKSNYYQNFDQRAFNFDMLSPQEKQAVVKSLGPQTSPAFQKFAKSYSVAKQAGFLGGAPSGQ